MISSVNNMIEEEIPCRPTNNDILFGKGKRTQEHRGNVEFRKLVNEKNDEYNSLDVRSNQKEKGKIMKEIIHKITVNGGRFLKFNEEKGHFYQVKEERVIRKKICDVFRESRRLFKTDNNNIGRIFKPFNNPAPRQYKSMDTTPSVKQQYEQKQQQNIYQQLSPTAQEQQEQDQPGSDTLSQGSSFSYQQSSEHQPPFRKEEPPERDAKKKKNQKSNNNKLPTKQNRKKKPAATRRGVEATAINTGLDEKIADQLLLLKQEQDYPHPSHHSLYQELLQQEQQQQKQKDHQPKGCSSNFHQQLQQEEKQQIKVKLTGTVNDTDPQLLNAALPTNSPLKQQQPHQGEKEEHKNKEDRILLDNNDNDYNDLDDDKSCCSTLTTSDFSHDTTNRATTTFCNTAAVSKTMIQGDTIPRNYNQITEQRMNEVFARDPILLKLLKKEEEQKPGQNPQEKEEEDEDANNLILPDISSTIDYDHRGEPTRIPTLQGTKSNILQVSPLKKRKIHEEQNLYHVAEGQQQRRQHTQEHVTTPSCSLLTLTPPPSIDIDMLLAKVQHIPADRNSNRHMLKKTTKKISFSPCTKQASATTTSTAATCATTNRMTKKHKSNSNINVNIFEEAYVPVHRCTKGAAGSSRAKPLPPQPKPTVAATAATPAKKQRHHVKNVDTHSSIPKSLAQPLPNPPMITRMGQYEIYNFSSMLTTNNNSTSVLTSRGRRGGLSSLLGTRLHNNMKSLTTTTIPKPTMAATNSLPIQNNNVTSGFDNSCCNNNTSCTNNRSNQYYHQRISTPVQQLYYRQQEEFNKLKLKYDPESAIGKSTPTNTCHAEADDDQEKKMTAAEKHNSISCNIANDHFFAESTKSSKALQESILDKLFAAMNDTTINAGNIPALNNTTATKTKSAAATNIYRSNFAEASAATSSSNSSSSSRMKQWEKPLETAGNGTAAVTGNKKSIALNNKAFARSFFYEDTFNGQIS